MMSTTNSVNSLGIPNDEAILLVVGSENLIHCGSRVFLLVPLSLRHVSIRFKTVATFSTPFKGPPSTPPLSLLRNCDDAKKSIDPLYTTPAHNIQEWRPRPERLFAFPVCLALVRVAATKLTQRTRLRWHDLYARHGPCALRQLRVWRKAPPAARPANQDGRAVLPGGLRGDVGVAARALRGRLHRHGEGARHRLRLPRVP